MMQLIAAIPTIISAVGKVTALFRKGQDAVAQVSGEASRASTPEELQREVQGMSADQQNRWAEIMAREVDRYAAENQRLATEIGLVDAQITGKLDQASASKIAMAPQPSTGSRYARAPNAPESMTRVGSSSYFHQPIP